jgi:leader peptidase (prepilin peptidase)/N-methyltransferase
MFNLINIFESFLIGICIGSFINVVIYRLPNDISIVTPRSFCPECKYKISWRENIPLISWIIQKGKCVNCNQKISIRYPFIEFTTGILFVIFKSASPFIYDSINLIFLENLFGWFFISLLFVISLIDINYLWIPQVCINIGFIIGLINLLFIQIISNFGQIDLLINCTLTSLISFFLFELLRLSAKSFFKKDALGKGDSKLVSMMALWLGSTGTIISLGISYIFAAFCLLIALKTKIIKRNQLVPFAPFLSIGGLVVWFFGNEFLIRNFLRY